MQRNVTRRGLLAAGSLLCAGAAVSDDADAMLAVHERETGGRIGLFARDLITGRTLAYRSDERFPMCSTFKMSLAACVLARVERHEEQLDRFVRYGPADILDYAPAAKQNLPRGGMSVAELCEAAIQLSDNTCANLLLASIGGPAALTAFWRATGDAVSRLEDNEPLLNRSPPGDPRNTTTPAAMAGNLQRFVLGDVLAAASRATLKSWMLGSKTGGALFRAGLPPGWAVADKTGSCAADILADIAVTWPAPGHPIVICVYTRGGTPALAQLQSVFADVGRAVGRQLA